jgi:hypothetical protein
MNYKTAFEQLRKERQRFAWFRIQHGLLTDHERAVYRIACGHGIPKPRQLSNSNYVMKLVFDAQAFMMFRVFK